MPALFQKAAYPSRVGADLDGDLHLLCGVEAAAEVLGGGTQPTLLDHLAAFVVEYKEVAVLVAKIQSRRHLRLLGATITHGPILLSLGHKEPVVFADPRNSTGYCARIGPSHIIYSDNWQNCAPQRRLEAG